MRSRTTSGSARTPRPSGSAATHENVVSDAEAERVADELLGAPVDTHVSRAYAVAPRADATAVTP